MKDFEEHFGRELTEDEQKIFHMVSMLSYEKGKKETLEKWAATRETHEQSEVTRLRQGIQKFVDKNFHGGSKCDREDYTQMVTCKDIYVLRELIRDK